MPYVLKEVKIRTDNSDCGLKTTEELWRDLQSGKLPLLFDSAGNFKRGVSPVSRYSGYESDEKGSFDLTVMGVTADFFRGLEERMAAGEYVKYDESAGNIGECAAKAWQRVWEDTAAGRLSRAYSADYESSVPPEYTKDGKAHCYLYIAVKR